MLIWTLPSFLLQVLLWGLASVLNHTDRVKVLSILYKFLYVLGDFLCFLYFNCFVKKSNSGPFRKFPGWFHHSSTHDLFSSQRIPRVTFILTAPKHLYASTPFFLSLVDCMALLVFYLSKEEKKRSGSQSVYLNLLQVLKLKAKYVFKIIYFYKGEQESASALILFLQFQGFEFKLFILSPCLY